MTQGSFVAFRRLAFAAAGLLILAQAGPAPAQVDPQTAVRAEPWHDPNGTTAKPKTATSSPSATEPNAAEQRETRKLAGAIFAKPGAAARAADKAAPPNTADIPPAQPKPEWLASDGLRPGGEGVQVKTPF